MAFERKKPEEDYPTSKRWEGDESSAREVCAWARDDALLPYAAVTPPDRNAEPGSPAAEWRMKLKVEVPAALGGGTQWVDVPKGTVIEYSGTRVDPVYALKAPAKAAADTFTEETE